ncbi:uncharacterized protein LOC126844088, partial [Adelges cooleyi]|uniref:uncharacterized protein LOC126844088 n=1 Tax=Adelges cooleyi TaxID=133065 RepID=UPI00218072D5
MLNDLNDNQKYQLVNGLIRAYSYVPALLVNRGRAKAFDLVISQERDILYFVTVQEPTIDLSDPIDYDTAVNNRHTLIHNIFHHVLHRQMNDTRMCKNGESTKCKLLGIITRALNPGFRYTQGCNE